LIPPTTKDLLIVIQDCLIKSPKDNFNRTTIPASCPNPVIKVPAFCKKTLSNVKITVLIKS